MRPRGDDELRSSPSQDLDQSSDVPRLLDSKRLIGRAWHGREIPAFRRPSLRRIIAPQLPSSNRESDIAPRLTKCTVLRHIELVMGEGGGVVNEREQSIDTKGFYV
jgi:hypothetical protein